VERPNGTLKKDIQIAIAGMKEEDVRWKKLIPQLVANYNRLRHGTIGMPPLLAETLTWDGETSTMTEDLNSGTFGEDGQYNEEEAR